MKKAAESKRKLAKDTPRSCNSRSGPKVGEDDPGNVGAEKGLNRATEVPEVNGAKRLDPGDLQGGTNDTIRREHNPDQ